jgi:hypothetical protein
MVHTTVPVTSRSRFALFVLLLGAFTLIQVLMLFGRGPAAGLSVLSVYALFGFASLLVQHVVRSPSGWSRLAESGLALAMAAAAAALVAAGRLDLRTAAQWGLFGAGSIGAVGYLRDIMGAADDEARRARRADWRDALIVPLAVMQVPYFLWATTTINPVFDAHVLGFERVLGLDLSAMAHRVFGLVPALAWPELACYYALPIGLAIVAQLQPTSSLRTRVLLAAIASGGAGFALYTVCPVVGLFVAYPDALPSVSASVGPFAMPALVPRNGMPSLHTAWALVIAFNAARLGGFWRTTLFAFAVFNLWAATAGVGHWVMDIVAAVPLAVAAQMVFVETGDTARRLMAALVLAAVTLGWIVAFRLGVPLAFSPAAAWLAALVTAVAPLWLLRILRQTRPAEPEVHIPRQEPEHDEVREHGPEREIARDWRPGDVAESTEGDALEQRRDDPAAEPSGGVVDRVEHDELHDEAGETRDKE